MKQDGIHRPLPEWMLCLRDPADETNDLGRKSPSILHAQATLRQLTSGMISDLNKNTRPSLLAPLVGDVYAHSLPHRQKLAERGHFVQRELKRAFTRFPTIAHEGQQNRGTAQETVKQESKQPHEPEEENSGLHAYLEDVDTVSGSAGDAIAPSISAER